MTEKAVYHLLRRYAAGGRVRVRSLRRDPGHKVSNTCELTNGSLIRISPGEPNSLRPKFSSQRLNCRNGQNGGIEPSPTRPVHADRDPFFEPRGCFSPFLFSPRSFC